LVIVERLDTAENFVIHIEFQVSNDARMHKRMYFYHALIYDQTDLSARQLVIYIGDESPNMKTVIEDGKNHFEYDLVWSKSFYYEDFLKSEKPEEVLFALLADFKGKENKIVITQIIARLQELSPDKTRFQKYVIQLEVLSQLRNLEQVTAKITQTMITYDIKRDPRFMEGRTEGKTSRDYEIIERMLSRGKSIKDITEDLGISIDFVILVQNELKKKAK
jgi:hypothetical protein